METYYFKDVLYLKKEKAIAVVNNQDELIGSIERAEIAACEKGHSLSFTTNSGNSVSMGIKKRGLKDLLGATYIIATKSKAYSLKDKPGNILLYFCVIGEIDERSIRVEENWQQEIEVKMDRKIIAKIKPNQLTFKTKLEIDPSITEQDPIFAVIFLIYFMFKIYKNETDVIENLLFD